MTRLRRGTFARKRLINYNKGVLFLKFLGRGLSFFAVLVGSAWFISSADGLSARLFPPNVPSVLIGVFFAVGLALWLYSAYLIMSIKHGEINNLRFVVGLAVELVGSVVLFVGYGLCVAAGVAAGNLTLI